MSGEFFPPPKNFKSHRTLDRDRASVARVIAAARATIATLD
jgi:hypothetical protein